MWFALLFQAEENCGMAMVYTLTESAKEWLNENIGGDDTAHDKEAEVMSFFFFGGGGQLKFFIGSCG